MSSHKKAINYQERAAEFKVGDVVIPNGLDDTHAGRVLQVWPAIGMIDVEFAGGSKRLPVEDVIRLEKSSTALLPPGTDNIPGGAGAAQVPGGPSEPVEVSSPPQEVKVVKTSKASPERVMHAFMKKAIYWANVDRHYRATQGEQESKCYVCPKDSTPLRPSIYKREDGRSVKLLVCPTCLFVVKTSDVTGHHASPVGEP